MIKIRLARGGSKNKPFYRIVAIDEQSKREGKPLEILGYWHPKKNIKKINKERIKALINKGAKTTMVVDNLLKDSKR